MREKRTFKPKPYEDEVTVCDYCGEDGGEFYTPYDLGGEEYPYEKSLDLHDKCKVAFIREFGPRIWLVMDDVIDEVKNRPMQCGRASLKE